MTELSVLIAIIFCLALTGCACGRFGTLVSHRTLTPSAEVVEVAGWGLLVRPTVYDGGLSLGYRHAIYIYPRVAGDDRPVGQTKMWGRVPLRSELPFFLSTREAGLEFQTVAGQAMLHLGLVDQSFSFVARAEQSLRGSFSYQRDNPERTALTVQNIPPPLSTLTAYP